jgi:hypothetical protein
MAGESIAIKRYINRPYVIYRIIQAAAYFTTLNPFNNSQKLTL